MWNYRRLCNYTKEAFDFLNGKVNKKFKVNKISFIPEKRVKLYNKKLEDLLELGFIELDEIFIDVNEITRIYELYRDEFNYVIENKHIKGLLIKTLIHELLHADQDIPYEKLNDDREKYKMEFANELETRNFIEKHNSELLNHFGDIEFLLNTSYYDKMKNLYNISDNEIEYITINNPGDKLFRYLTSLTLIDIKRLLEECNKTNVYEYNIVIINGKKVNKFSASIELLLEDEETQYELMDIITDKMLLHKSYLSSAFLIDKILQFEFIKIGSTIETIQLYPALTMHSSANYIKEFIIDTNEINFVSEWKPFFR